MNSGLGHKDALQMRSCKQFNTARGLPVDVLCLCSVQQVHSACSWGHNHVGHQLNDEDVVGIANKVDVTVDHNVYREGVDALAQWS